MSSNKVIFEQPGGNTGVNHDHPTAALHITQEHGHDTQPILKLESPDPTISFIDSTNPGKDLHMLWNGGGSQMFKWFMNDVANPEMVLSKDGVLGVGVHSFTGVQDGSPSVLGSDILEPKIYTDGSIQITNGTGAFVVGAGSGSFLRDEELGFGWGGGWYMTDNTYLRVRNNKHVYSAGGATFTGVTSNSNIEINSTSPVLILKDTNATSAQTHDSFISFKSSEGTERAWVGFGGVTDNKFRIVNKWETPVHIHGSCAGTEPLSTLIVQDNSDSNHAGILIAGHENKQTHLRFQHGDDLMWQWRVPMHSSSNGDSMRLYSWTADGDVLTVDNGGNVGIGTTSPSVKLDISTNDTTGLRLINPDSAQANQSYDPPAILFQANGWDTNVGSRAYSARIRVNSGYSGAPGRGNTHPVMNFDLETNENNPDDTLSTKMMINADGNVGIGTTNPFKRLHIHHDNGQDGSMSVGGSHDIYGLQLGYNQDGPTVSTIRANTNYTNPSTLLKLGTNNNVDQLVLKGDGNVGIGTANPAYKLTLEDTGHNYLGITGGNQHIAGVLFGDTNNKSIGRIYYNNADNSMTFRTNGTDRMTINSSGNAYVSGSVRSTRQVRASGWFNGDTAGHGPAAEIGISGDVGYLMNFDRENAAYGTIAVQSRYCRARFDNDGLIRIGKSDDAHADKQLHISSQTGLFGVGKTPSYKLDVGGDINYTGKLMKNGSEQTTANTSNFVRKEGLGSAHYYSADTWIEFRDTNSGLYWGGSQSGANWHMYPLNGNDMRFRSGNSSNGIAIRLEAGTTTANGYVYANVSNDVGFLNQNRNFILKLSGQKVTLGGPDTEWNLIHAVNGPNAIHFNRHERFWIGAGNGTWFTGSANSKSQASGFNATSCHDLLITTMSSTSTYDRGITFAVATNDDKNAGYRLGKWHSGDAKDSSKLVVDGQIFAKAGNTDEYDYYGNIYSSYYSSQGGQSHWSGDTEYGWHVPGIVSSSAIQIQSGNAGTASSRKPQLQFHQYGYGGPAIQYDGPGKNLDIIAPTTRLSNSTGLRFRGQTVWHAGNDGSGSGLDADKLDGLHASSFMRADGNFTITKGSRFDLNNNLSDWAVRIGNSSGTNSYVYMAGPLNGMHIRNDSSGTSNYLLDVYAVNGNRFRVRGADAFTTINGNEVIHTGNIATHAPAPTGPSQWILQATGNYGTVKVGDNRGVTWAGYAIRGDWVLMSDGANTCGIYNDNDNEWGLICRKNAAVELHYNGAEKLSTQSSGIKVTGPIQRHAHNSGHLEGGYNSIAANSAKTNPIYTIGSGYRPNDATLGNMYGVGFSSNGAATYFPSTIKNGSTGWGMYVAADGDARIFLNSSAGTVESTGNHYAGGYRCLTTNDEGSGKGIDADTVDGLHASSFLRTGSSSQSIYGTEFYSSSWFRSSGSALGMYNSANDAHFYSAGNNYWHINGNSGDATSGGLVFYSRYNASQGHATGRKGYVYWSSDGFGLLDNDGSWAVKTQFGNLPLQLSCNGNTELEVHTSYVKALGSFRAPHFYVDGNIYHNGDTNTYVGFHAADQFRVVTGGTEQMEWGNGYVKTSSNFRANKIYPHNSGDCGYFYSDGGTRVAYTGGDFYIQSIGNYYNYATNQYHGNTSGDNHYFRGNALSGNSWSISTGGTIQGTLLRSTGDITAYYSDDRLKTDIKPIDGAIDKITSIDGFYYHQNDTAKQLGFDNDQQQVGVSAQTVKQVLPHAVTLAPIDSEIDEDGVETSKSGEDYLTVKYDKLVPLLIEGIKEQQKQIVDQQKRIDALESKLNNL